MTDEQSLKEIQIKTQISKELKINQKAVDNVISLLDEGNTIPFIARYRKEQTGSLDEVQIYDIQQNYQHLTQLEQRREEIHRLISERDKLTPEIEQQLEQATTLTQLEDIYRPYKKRRRTLAMTAIENGLEPLANWLLDPTTTGDINTYAEEFINEEVEDSEAALKGAFEIIAQESSDNAQYREFIRKYTRYNGELVTKVKNNGEEIDERGVYRLYYDFSEKLPKVQEYQVLAINRSEKEEVITVKVEVDEKPAVNYISKRYIPSDLPEEKRELVEEAVVDGYNRFIQPSIEREMRNELTEKAERQAISVFGENLKNLLLQAPVKGQVILGFDPAYRTGCKLAVINEQGQFLEKLTIFPHTTSNKDKIEAERSKFIDLIEKHQVNLIAIGNGTASRESEQFVSETLKLIDRPIQYAVVSEAGASVYSASKEARDEFPDLQVEERSAISIARRVQDPLAELIKIDPKSLGVGQYQHDVSQTKLTEELDFVVNTTVNKVGVDLNTASPELLKHVSGLTSAVANNIVDYRNENGEFTNRNQLKDVKRLGPKAFEQSAGFLRIIDGDNLLDQTSIHPESYPLAKEILASVDLEISDIGTEKATNALNSLAVKDVANTYSIAEETASDILNGLLNPTADIRDTMDGPLLREDVTTIEDLSVGLLMQGVVRNVVDFGAFVDIGVGEDGLIHKSKMNIPYKEHPASKLSVGDIVNVEILDVDVASGRIGLSLKE